MRLPRLARVATAALAVVAFAHCGDPSGSDRITEITIATPVPTLLVGPGGGQTRQLTATATTQNGKTVASPAFTWASFDPLIASVSQTGLVTAVAPGTTTISAAAGSAVDAILVIVADVPPATVTANADSVSLTHNTLFGAESRQLSAVLRDSTGTALPGRPVVWTTNAPLVAGV